VTVVVSTAVRNNSNYIDSYQNTHKESTNFIIIHKTFFFLVHFMCLPTQKKKNRNQTETQQKKCVAYPQEDFLFIKLISSLRISLLNNCKIDFQFHTESKFFYTKYKIFFT
jgi:hypothetical protein